MPFSLAHSILLGPLFGIGILFTGVYNIYQAVFIYLAEACELWEALGRMNLGLSKLTGRQSRSRELIGA